MKAPKMKTPKIGDILKYDGRTYVVIGMAGTDYKRYPHLKPNDKCHTGIPGYHVQDLNTGELATITNGRKEVLGTFMEEQSGRF